MSSVRKDKKGRNLRTGESQRSDGQYMYRYNDPSGVRRTVYSWRLVATDRLPEGKRNGPPLRELEKQITMDMNDGINPVESEKKTVNDMFDAYMALRTDLSNATRAGYTSSYNAHIRMTIGIMKIKDVKPSDLQQLYLSLIEKDRLKFSSVQQLNTIVMQIFDYGVSEGLIRSNPAKYALKMISKTKRVMSQPKQPLTQTEQEIFFLYVKTSYKYRRWLNFFIVIFGTGMRIGEILGLQWSDCDFGANVINVSRKLEYLKINTEKREFYISSPKTFAGIRKIPMLKEVRQALLEQKVELNGIQKPLIPVGEYNDFVFRSRNGGPMTPTSVFTAIRTIVASYNLFETERARIEERDPVLLPKFSAHTFRHTFCSIICENETDLKNIQEIMGHAHISTTMDIYNKATLERKQATMQHLEGKIKFG